MKIRIYAKNTNQIRMYIPLIRSDVVIEGICVNEEEERKSYLLFQNLTKGLAYFLKADCGDRMSDLSKLVSYIMVAIDSFTEKDIPLVD